MQFPDDMRARLTEEFIRDPKGTRRSACASRRADGKCRGAQGRAASARGARPTADGRAGAAKRPRRRREAGAKQRAEAGAPR